MLKKLKVALLLAMAFVFALQGVGMETAQAAPGDWKAQDVTVANMLTYMGDATSYGVVAIDYWQKGHSEANVFVDNLAYPGIPPILASNYTNVSDSKSPLSAMVTLPEVHFADEMTFGLYTKEGDTYVPLNIEETVPVKGKSEVLVDFGAITNMNALGKELYVLQVENDTPVLNGAENTEGLKVTYGPSVKANGSSVAYIGSIDEESLTADMVKLFQDHGTVMQGFYNGLTLGSDLALYRSPDAENPLPDGDGPAEKVYIRDVDWVDGKYYEFGALSYDGTDFWVYPGTPDAHKISITCLNKNNSAEELLGKMTTLSEKLANSELGIGGQAVSLGTIPSAEGNSTVKGEMASDGTVVSLYAMETVVDGNMIKLDPQSIYPADADHSQPSLLNAQGLPLAENEYAVINVVVPAPAGGEDNRTLVLHDAHLRLVNSDGSKDKADADHWRAGNASNYGRVIWNPVYLGSDGNYHPYTGTVLAGQNHGGMVLVPEGKTISYTTTEAATLVAQYVECHDEVHQGSFQANNTFVKMVGETVDVKGEKKWAGDAGNEGARPDKITLTLWAQVPEVGKVKVDTITLPILENKPDGTVTEKWNWEIKGLPKEANGANIEYSIEEDKFSYYEESYGDPVYEGAPKDKPDEYKKVKLDVTNTYDENLIVVKGEKVWEDDNDRDGIRPDEITVKLQARAKWRWKYAQSFGYNPWNEQFWSWPASDEEGWADYGSFGYLNIPEDVVDELKVSADDDWKWSFGELQNKTMPQMWYYPSYGQPMYLQYEIDWQFRVVEEQVEGYETTIEGSSGTSYTITNAHESDTIDLTGKKIWWPENYNNKSEVTVKLFKNGEDTGRTAVANEKNGWQWIFTDLDKKENGEDITYTVEEQNAPNGFWVEYVKNQDGSIDIINSKKEVRLKGQKIWKDQNGNNFSPNNVPIEIKIYRDNGTGNKADDTLMATETRWDWSIELPGYAPDGSDAKYYVEESPVPNYTADVQPGATGEEHGFKIYNWTVTNTLKTIEMSVEKVWDDLDPALRPTKLRFTLYQDGVEYRDNYGTKWVEYDVVNPPSEPIKFSGLLEFRPDGTPYEYSIKEEYWFVGPYNQYYMDKWPGYVSSGESGEVVDGKFVYTLTNTQETVDLGGTKNWSGYGYGGHPTEVTLKVLYQKGEEWVEYAQEKITGAGNAASWSWTISNLPKYIDGQEVAYTVQEEYITGYVPEVSGSMTEGFTINNTAVQEIDITVAKKWVDGDNPNRPASVQVRLVRDNTPMTGARYTLELKADNNWTATFENLPVGEMRGDWWNRVYHAFTYDVQEVAVPDGYEVEISGDAGNGFEVKNTMTNFTGTLALRKTDDAGAALGGAVFTVYSDEACQTVKGTMEQGADGVHTLADLEPGDYWVKETTVPGGYTAEETVYPVTVIANQITDVVTNAAVAEATSATAIVNTKLQGEGELTISKTLTNAAKLFQEQTFTFTLYKYDNYQTGDAVGTASVSYTANAGSENTTAMLKFPLEFGAHTYLLVEETDDNAALVYDGTQYEITVKTKAEDGKLVAESITMIHQDGSAADELSFINTFNNETSITVTKAWNDDNNAANARPESITVNLMNGAQVVDTVVLSQDGQWTYTFADLPKQDANGNISYSVQEVEVGNYISVIGGNAQDGFTITNTYNVTEVKVEKKWDRVAEEEQVPVTVELVRNGSGTGETIELNAENEWKGSFTGLEKFDDNDNAYTYSVTEIDPDDFVASYTGNAQDGYIITNAIVRDGSEYYFYKASKENNVTTALKGAEFTLYSDAACTDVITKAVSDENGRVSIFIPDQYTQNGALVYLKETKAPSGYEPIEGTFSFNANKNDTPTSIPWIFQNVNPAPEIDWGFNSGALINKKLEQQEGGFKFTKRNVTGDALPGAVFGVYSDEACTAKLNELTTDEYGEASLTGLEAGKTYYIKEITAPTGYELNGTVYSVTIEAGVDDKLVGDNGVIINERNTIDLCVYKNWHNAEGNIENDTLGVNVSGALELYILSANGDQTLVKGTDGNALQPEFEDGKGENVPDLYWWRNMPILSEGEQYIVKENLSKVPAGVVVHYNSDPEGTKGYETSDSGDFSIYNSYFQGFEVFVANKKVDGQYVEDTFAFELRDAKTGEVVAKKDSVFGPDMTGIFDPDNPPPEEEWVNQVLLTVNYDEEDLPEKVGGLTEYEYILREVDAGGDYIYDTAEYEYKVTIDRMGKTRMFIKVNGEYQPFTLSHDEPVFENKAAVSISGTKVWDDNNNAGGTRPEEITIRLYADGEETDKSVTLKSGETEWSFTGLPKYAADGREIIYTADESDVPKGYVKTVTGDAASGFVITNTLKQGEGALDFTKYLTFSDYTLIPKEGYTFTFTLTPDANTPDAYTLVDNAELAEDVTSITPVVEDGKVVSYTLARKLYSRDVVNMMQVWSTLKITFTEPGTYTFTLQEKAPNPTPEGWYYDTKPHPIQFVVTEGETELEVENKNDRPPEIYNELKKKEITIYKSWNDSGYEEDRLDTTELLEYLNAWYSTDNGATWKDYGKLADLQTEEENSVVVEDWGSGLWYVNVKDLPFYIGGKEVQWSIVEKLPEGSHYETVYGDPNGFDVTAGLTGTDANNTTIFNIHEVEMTFEGTKTMTGRALTEKDIFTFEITEDGTSNSWTAQNDAKGKINFPTFTYGLSDIGLHKYTVKETSASANGIKTDEQVYELCVTVAVEYGALTLTYDADCVSVDFTNAYEAKGEITFEGTKTIEGREWREDDIYSFEVCEEGSYTAVANNDLTGKINYPTITYTQDDVGEHVYTIREISDGGNGITVDDNVYTVTVEVADNGDGSLTVTATENATELDFTNTYETKGSIQFSGVKTLDGKDLAGDDFSFQLIGEDGNVIETVKNDADGKIAFSAIEYDQNDAGKTFTYTVKEVNDEQPGIIYDQRLYTVTVTVVDDGYGTLTVIPNISESNMNFTNTYEAVGEITFSGTKTLEGRDMTDFDVFTFSIMEGENEIATVTNDAEGNIVFPAIKYHLEDVGEYTYTIREISEDGNGITVDDTVYTVTVEVADNGDGTLDVTADLDETALNFVNTYAADGSVQFSGSKTLTGKALAAEEFSFQLLDSENEVIETVKNGADGKFAFSEIAYTLDDVGTHTYTMQEVNDEQPGIGYDPTIYTITVIVQDNGDGTLYVTADLDETVLKFTNTYEAVGEITFAGVKTIEGRALTENDVFVFAVKEGEKTIVTASNDADGNIVFPTIEYTLDDVGTHTYTVKETSPSGLGITADPTEYTVTVEVADNGDGTLAVEATGADHTKLDFTNTYEAEGEIVFSGVKTIEGRALTANDKFTFEIKEGEKTIATVTNDADGKIAYPTIEYTLADVGTHTYTVKETSTDGNGITVDTTEYTVVVTVIDGGHGKLDAMADVDHTALNFTNTYEAKGEIVLEGTKTLVGRELAAGEFEFELIDEAGDVVATATNDAEGKITFTKLTYETADIGKTYIYTAKEITGSLLGVTYDAAPITVKVAIADNGDGTLKVTKTVDSADIAFTNTYSAEGAILLAGTKSLSGRALAAGEFSFELYDANGNLLQTVTNDAKGAIAFAEIKYELTDAGKTFTYTVKEKAGDLPGVTYDDAVITVEVEVKDVGGKLTATLTQNSEAIAFTNTYEADGEIVFSGVKTLEGRDLTDGEFGFQLIDAAGKVIETVKNDADGKIAFSKITYTLADVGEHAYTVKEVVGTDGEITYDSTVYEIKVTVADNGDGTLNVTADKDVAALNFVNTYTEYKAEGEIVFSGVKTLEGRDLAADEFSFQLIDAEGKVVETVKNDADGKIAFSKITYTLADVGEHAYTVKEVAGTDGEITYDSTVYEITVTVEDNDDGTLNVTADKDVAALNFVNTYTEYKAEGEIVLEGAKTLVGRDLTDGEFSFQLIDAAGKVIETVKNAADGKIAFTALKYTLADVGEHAYTVKEVAGTDGEITYDSTVYEIKVTVEDNGDGTLNVEADIDETALDFTNTYKKYTAEGEIQFSGTKTLTGREEALKAGEFSFKLEGEGKSETVTNAANGKITFTPIKYTLDDLGDHVYTVTEIAGDADEIAYDPAKYEIKVNVDDNGTGTLDVKIASVKKDGQTIDGTTFKFVNSYGMVYTEISGLKMMDGRAFKAGDSFTLELWEEGGNAPIKTATITSEGGASAGFDFGQMTFYPENAGETYTYLVKESIPADAVDNKLNGVIYDDTVYTVKLEVSYNNGKLEVGRTYFLNGEETESIIFTNGYEAAGEIVFSGTKTLTGREEALKAGEFSFKLEGEGKSETVTNKADGSFEFSKLSYTEADAGKTFTYTVKEVNDGKAGITYDDTEYTMTVTVSDNGDGTLDAMADVDHTALNFTNTYEAKGEIVLEGAKTLVGRELAAGEFEFELIDEAGDVVATATNDAEGKITFTKLTYDTADIGKTYTYTAKEITGSLPGVIYDAAPITVKVAIADNGDGTLKVTKTVDSADIAFTNTYSAEGAILLAGTKSLSGRALAAGEFSFELYDANGNLLQTVTNDAKGAIAFAEIKYELTDAGKTFTYTVKEKAGDLPGVTYDDAVITVEVEVKDVGGKLTANLTQNSEAIAFTNTYEADGEIVFSGVKTLVGRDLTEGEFSFQLIDAAGKVIETVKNAADGKIAFSKITYTLADVGEHAYTVKEVVGTDSELTYDSTVYEIKVTVADNGDGTLNVTASDNATALNFTNTYESDGEIVFSGVKTLEGRDLAADEFSFQLIDAAGKVVETVKNDADGKIAFSKITYTLADVGEHAYTVKEGVGTDGEITYDSTVYEITVTVEDNGDGTLNVTADKDVAALNFVNTYTEYKADGEIVFSGEKTLEGRDLTEGEFSFQLIDAAGKVIETVKNDADGKIAFSKITYTLADVGEHAYTVKEVTGEDKEITYDSTVYEITVTVADNGDGTLKVTADKDVTALNFANTYTEYKAEGEIVFSGVKTLEGRDLAADEFSFQLIDAEGKVIETVKNDADGKIAFSKITYTLADVGEHAYTVKEVAGTDGEITYDSTVYEITVTVEDNGDGTLNVTADKDVTALDFVNTYTEYTADGEIVFSGVKTLEGRDLATDEFSFQLIDAAGKVIETVKNDADGKIAFSKITYTLADVGEHAYTVKEVVGTDGEITYDSTVYEITVTVEDNGDGTLNVTADKDVAALNFVNNYTQSKGNIGVMKVDSRDTTKGLAGAEFFVYSDAECTVKKGVIITGESGAGILTGLPVGTYYVKETKAPEGYAADTEKVYIVTVVKDDTAMVNGTYVTNDKLASLKLEKSDRLDPEKKLPGAVYTVYTDEECLPEHKFADITTGEDGTGILENVPEGIYWVKETKAPEGYEIDPLPYKVVVDKDADPEEPVFVPVSDFPLRGALTLSKTVVASTQVEESFLFDVELAGGNGPVEGSYEATLNGVAAENVVFTATESGAKATVSLKDNETMVIHGLRAGVTYTVTEQADARYETQVNGAQATAATGTITESGVSVARFQNTLKQVSFTVDKVWQGEDAGEIQLTLYANGVAMDPQPAVTRNGNTYTYADLAMVDAEGKEIVYTVKETAMAGYTTTYENVAPNADKTDCAYNGGKIINQALTSFSVKKEWSGLAQGETAPAIQLTLYCNGVVYTASTPAPDANGYYTYNDLPATVNGQPAVYTVKETEVTGFTTTYVNKGENASVTDCAYNGGTIVNTKIPQTGDGTPLALWMLMTMLAGCGLAGVTVILRKREN